MTLTEMASMAAIFSRMTIWDRIFAYFLSPFFIIHNAIRHFFEPRVKVLTVPEQRDPYDPSPRKDYISWTEFFYGVAQLSARRSKDPKTQVGAVIVDSDKKQRSQCTSVATHPLLQWTLWLK